ncbi:MAG: PAS domain S-box protein [Chlorobi bacterium]|nr:PAS domain S-box protein [Chlorobiota bacterium]
MSFFTVFLLFFTWAGVSSLTSGRFTINSIFYIHTKPFVWFIDFVILSLPLSFVFFVNYHKIKTAKLKKELNKLYDNSRQNVELAEKIGRGELDLDVKAADSKLSEVLLNLGQNLKHNQEKENVLNWISKGKDLISDILRSYNNIESLSIEVLKKIIEYNSAVQGAFYIYDGKGMLKNIATYAYGRQRFIKQEIPVGKGLIGETAYEKQYVFRTEIPDDYFTLTSGILGDRKPKGLLIVPLVQEDELQGVYEIAFISENVPEKVFTLAEELSRMIGQTIYNLKINKRTEQLLKESQEMTEILKKNEEQLKQNAIEMLEAQEQLEKSNKLLESQIQEVEHGRKKLQALLTNASEFISIYNERQQLLFESPSVKRILGYDDDDEDVRGMDPELLTPKGYRTINELFQYLLETPGGQRTAQYTYLKKNGEKLFLETRGTNLLHDPAIRGLIFNTRDITERKRAEKEERMKSRMQSLSENSPDMIIRINTSGKLIYVNPAVTVFVGVPASELVKKRISELKIDPRFIQFVKESLISIRDENKEIISEITITSSEGERVMEIKGIPEYNDDNDLESILFVAHDITEIKIIEQQLKEKNKKISDSINYAQRIQSSILPDTKSLQQHFPRSFIFYRPKDVVSGDFPWFFKKDDTYYVAAVDCTGHGVPGALLSFIGYFLLNNIVNTDKNYTAAEILDKLHYGVRKNLKQDQEGANGRDGMDLALCKISPEKGELQFAGAHRPLYLVRNGELIEFKGTRKGIGGTPLPRRVEKDFENNIIKYQKGDKIFIFSDGLPDQIGGKEERKKKYQARRIREALVEDPSHTMAYYSRFFPKDFFEWMGEEKQVDDVLLIGIEL